MKEKVIKNKSYCTTYVKKNGTFLTICNYKYGHAHHK